MGIEDLIQQSAMIVTMGKGGVGKTTVSAAIGIKAATMGSRVLVLTIDPANRLADAFGVDTTMVQPTELFAGKFSGALFGMMLHRKTTCDNLVNQFARDEGVKKSIKDSPYYQHFSTSLAGGQEFMAVDEVARLYDSGLFDLIILDTPPATHAFDFLDSPKRLRSGWSSIASHKSDKPDGFIARLRRQGGRMVVKGLDRMTGDGFIHELIQFISLFGDILGALSHASSRLTELLERPETSFILVDTASTGLAERFEHYRSELGQRNMSLYGVIANRCTPFWMNEDKATRRTILEEMGQCLTEPEREELEQCLTHFANNARDESVWIHEVRRRLPQTKFCIAQLPSLRGRLNTTEGLREMIDSARYHDR